MNRSNDGAKTAARAEASQAETQAGTPRRAHRHATTKKITVAIVLLISALSAQIVAQSQVSANSATQTHDWDETNPPNDGAEGDEVAAEQPEAAPQGPIETALADLLKPPPTRTRAPTRTRTPTRTPTATRTPRLSPTPIETNPPPMKSTATSTSTATATKTSTTTPQPTGTSTATATPTSPAETPASTPQSPTPTGTPSGTPPTPALTVSPVVSGEVPVQVNYLPVAINNYPCDLAFPDCFEPNNTFDEAVGPFVAPVVLVGTSSQAEDPFDFFAATFEAGVTYSLSLDVGSQDLDLYIYGQGRDGDIRASSATSGLGVGEQLTFTPSTTGPYYVLVYTYRSNGPDAYQLSILR